MSYQSGWKALNLEFSDRVPRTEYSAESYHWPLIQRVTGIDTSIEANREEATKEFVKKWDYANTPVDNALYYNKAYLKFSKR